MSVIDELMVKIGFDVDERGAKKADSELAGIANTAKGIGAALGLAFGTGAALSGITRYADEMDRLGKAAQLLQVTGREIKFFDFFFKQSGAAEGNEGESFITNLNKIIEDGRTGNQKFIKSIEELIPNQGVDASAITQFLNASKSGDRGEIISAIQSMLMSADPKSRKTVGETLGLTQAQTVALTQGNLSRSRQQFNNRAMSNEEFINATRAGEEFNTALANMTLSLDTLTNRITQKVLPTFTEGIKELDDVLSGKSGIMKVRKGSLADELLGDVELPFGLKLTEHFTQEELDEIEKLKKTGSAHQFFESFNQENQQKPLTQKEKNLLQQYTGMIPNTEESKQEVKPKEKTPSPFSMGDNDVPMYNRELDNFKLKLPPQIMKSDSITNTNNANKTDVMQNITINVNGAQNPTATANEIRYKLQNLNTDTEARRIL